nr:putative reverse transcriptase domain-containing protein [Tanacetum cinerariifolium]
MSTSRQGMTSTEIDQIVAQRVTDAIEAIVVYEAIRMDNHVPQQPPFKKPDVSRSYTIRANERKAYAGNLPYSNKYAQVEAIKDEKFIIKDLYGMIKKLEQRTNGTLCLNRRSWIRCRGMLAYRLELPEQLSRLRSTFHVSNLKKCFVDETLAIPLDEIQINDKLNFIEEPVEIMDREVKWLNQSLNLIVKVRLYSRRGPEFTSEREDQNEEKVPSSFRQPFVYVLSFEDKAF